MSLTRVRISMHKNKKEQGEKEAAEKKKGEEDAARDSIVVVIVCRHPRLAAAAAAAAAWSPPTTRLRSCDSGKPKKSANSVAPVQRTAWGRGPWPGSASVRPGPVRLVERRSGAERRGATAT